MAAASAAKVHLRCICGALKVHLQCIGRGRPGHLAAMLAADPIHTGQAKGEVTRRRGAADNPPAVCTNLLARQEP